MELGQTIQKGDETWQWLGNAWYNPATNVYVSPDSNANFYEQLNQEASNPTGYQWTRTNGGWVNQGGNFLGDAEWNAIPENVRALAGNDPNTLYPGTASDQPTADSYQRWIPNAQVRDWSGARMGANGLELPTTAYQPQGNGIGDLAFALTGGALLGPGIADLIGGGLAGLTAAPTTALDAVTTLANAGAGLGGMVTAPTGTGAIAGATGGIGDLTTLGSTGGLLGGSTAALPLAGELTLPATAAVPTAPATVPTAPAAGPLTAPTSSLDQLINAISQGGTVETGGVPAVPNVPAGGLENILQGGAGVPVSGPLGTLDPATGGLLNAGVDLSNSALTNVPSAGSDVVAAPTTPTTPTMPNPGAPVPTNGSGTPSAASGLSQWLKDNLGLTIDPSTLGLLGTGLNTALGMWSANQQANKLGDIATQANTQRAPFLNAATGLLANPASYWNGPIGTELARSTANALSSSYGNLFDSPGGQVKMMQALAPSYMNTVTQLGNLGLGNQALVSGLQTQAANASGTPYSVLGSGIANLTQDQSGVDINKIIAQALKSQFSLP